MINAQALTKRRNRRDVVSDVTFRCEPGTVTGFLGPNGAGKTTTMRMLVGLPRPTADRPACSAGATATCQTPAAALGSCRAARSRGARHSRPIHGRAGATIDTVLELVGLAETAAGRRVGRYSLGMRQRLGLAHALLGDPELLILDEPTNGLDRDRMRWMRGRLRDLADRGGTVLLSSHLLAEVEAVADRMIIIGDGQIQAQGTRAELLRESGTIVEADDLATLDAALHSAGLTTHPVDGDRLLVEAQPEVIARLAMTNDIVLRRLAPAQGAGLERLFFKLTTAGAQTPPPNARELAGAVALAQPGSPHRFAWTGPTSTRARASAASPPSSCAR